MWDKILKQKGKRPGMPEAEDQGESTIEIPEVDETLGDVDAALKASDDLRKQAEKQEAQKLVNEANHCSCCCFDTETLSAIGRAKKLLGF